MTPPHPHPPSPRVSEDFGNSHFVKDATIKSTHCARLWREVCGSGESQMICEIHEKCGDNMSYWTLRLSIVFKRVKNNYFLLW